MSLQLSKGSHVDLTKGRNLSKIFVALGWDPSKYSGSNEFDLDASAFILDAQEKCRRDADVVFYNNLQHESGSIIHSGDNLTGVGASGADKEIIRVNLKTLPISAYAISFVVSIFEYDKRNQNFGMVSHAFIRIVDETTNQEILRYDLSDSFSMNTAVIFGKMYRKDGEWKFEAVGEGYSTGLAGIVKDFGLTAT